MKSLQVLVCLVVVFLFVSTIQSFVLPHYARNDPYLKRLLTPKKGSKSPNQFQLYMAREYLDELEPYDNDPHDMIESRLEPDFF